MEISKNKLAAFVLIAIATVALFDWLRSPVISLVEKSAPHTPDAYMEGINATIMDPDGEPHIKIIAPKWVHFTENDESEVVKPSLTLFRMPAKAWSVSADYATMKDGIDEIHFRGGVTVHYDADDHNPETTIKTPALTVHTKMQTAETNDMITLIQPNLLVKSVGLHANIKAGDIHLLSQAEAEYLPD
jgi:LPS export ABC transporter protein LptC